MLWFLTSGANRGTNSVEKLNEEQFIDLIYRSEAALNYTKNSTLMEQVEVLIGALIEMKELGEDGSEEDEEGNNVDDTEGDSVPKMTSKERMEAAAECIKAADKLFEACEIEASIGKAEEAIDLAYEGSLEWEEAMLILGQAYQVRCSEKLLFVFFFTYTYI